MCDLPSSLLFGSLTEIPRHSLGGGALMSCGIKTLPRLGFLEGICCCGSCSSLSTEKVTRRNRTSDISSMGTFLLLGFLFKITRGVDACVDGVDATEERLLKNLSPPSEFNEDDGEELASSRNESLKIEFPGIDGLRLIGIPLPAGKVLVRDTKSSASRLCFDTGPTSEGLNLGE